MRGTGGSYTIWCSNTASIRSLHYLVMRQVPVRKVCPLTEVWPRSGETTANAYPMAAERTARSEFGRTVLVKEATRLVDELWAELLSV